jgi:hypothetical protein
MILLWLSALLADPASLAGFYRSSTPEVGAAIELDSDGTFLYALDYGAVSESAEGRWTVEGNQVLITATKAEGAWKGARLDRTPLAIDGNALVLQRYDRAIRFVAVGELAPPPNRNTKLDKKD